MFPSLLNRIDEIMVTKAITASPDEFLADAARRMEEKRVGCLVVALDWKVLGILSE